MKTKHIKRKEAEARQKLYDALTREQRVAKLDAKLGKNAGAGRERAKLEA